MPTDPSKHAELFAERLKLSDDNAEHQKAIDANMVKINQINRTIAGVPDEPTMEPDAAAVIGPVFAETPE